MKKTINVQNNVLKNLLYAALFVALFIVIHSVFEFGTIAIYAYLKGLDLFNVAQSMQSGKYSDVLIAANLLSSVAAILIYIKMKWAPISRTYLQTKPWGVLFWAAMLSIGIILPAQFVYEKLQITMSDNMTQLFEGIMRQPLGYLVVGILAPITEELIFRGAILRVLLNTFEHKGRWIAIALTALIFAFIHGNIAQGVHAFIIGLALGWMYMRTKSVLPGIVLHWVNNTIAYLMFNLMPHMADGKLIDYFHGSERSMYLGLLFSLCILVPALFQLSIRMKQANK